MGLGSINDNVLHIVLSQLSPKEVALVSCVEKRLKLSASDDGLWANICSQDLDLHTPLDPHGNLAPSFKEAYYIWRESFGIYPWSLVKRVKRCWDGLKNWLTENFPEAKATLRKGASEADIQELENALKLKLPIPTRILYRFCDGQEFSCKNFSKVADSSLGVIGGYSYYRQFVNVHLLPLSRIIQYTKGLWRHLPFPSSSKFILVAAASKLGEKYFFLSCADGQLYVGTRNLFSDVEMLPCVPRTLISLGDGIDVAQQQDAMLLWLEEHVRRLQNGIIRVREEDEVRSISLFPEEPPLCSTAITRNVKVRASAVFVPEQADLQSDSDKYLYAYSVRMALLPEGCVVNGRTIGSCQLCSRHWTISANNVVLHNVNAQAVIGQYPLLLPGAKEFVYQSCTPLPAASGSIKGSFTFFPGSLEDPKEDPFDAEVAEIPLQLPDYIF